MLTLMERTTRCLNTMQRVERALKARVQELGGDPKLTFRWNEGGPVVPLPDPLALEVTARGGRPW